MTMNRSIARACALCAVAFTGFGVAGCAPDTSIDRVSATIADGMPEDGYPGVVFIYNRASSGACTGTLLTASLVLTGKHCVQVAFSNGERAAPATDFTVSVGPMPSSPVQRVGVREVRYLDGAWVNFAAGRTLIQDGSDIAMLFLATPITDPEIYEIGTADPSTLVGMDVTAIGYGQLRGVPGNSRKHSRTVNVYAVMFGLPTVTAGLCPGDSGGPLLPADRKVYGVASFLFADPRGMMVACGDSPTAFSPLYPHLAWVRAGIADSLGCTPTGEEVCDGADNDCDARTDEDCLGFGEPCTDDAQCSSTLCAMTSAGRICTQACDPLAPTMVCADGSFCERTTGCDGLCAPGVAGARALFATCATHTDCASLLCVDPGDGTKRCLAPCRGGTMACASGEVCSGGATSCGGCAMASTSTAPRAFGEPCATAAECASTMCAGSGASAFCTKACTDDMSCGPGFRCRMGSCARGTREMTGGPCDVDDDCVTGAVCITPAGTTTKVCAMTCATSMSCSTGSTCMPAGSGMACVISGAALGTACTMDAACASGSCDAMARVCTRPCSSAMACPANFECRRASTSTDTRCLPSTTTAPPPRGGGCAIAASRGRSSGAVVLALFAALALVGRRRRGYAAS